MNQGIAQFQLMSIVNMDTKFSRELHIDKELYSNATSDITLSMSNQFGTEEFSVHLTIELKQKLENIDIVDIMVTSAGIFKTNGEVDEATMNRFCEINAPGIIFPFVREVIVSLSLKGGLPPIIIQPINFVEMSKDKKAE
jgi:protein-export chaperone SecB